MGTVSTLAQPPGPEDISAQQTTPAQPHRTQPRMKRLVESCSLMGRKGFCFSPYRAVVTRMGVLRVLVSVTERFSPLCAKAFQILLLLSSEFKYLPSTRP